MSNSVNLSLDVTKTGIQNPLIKVRQGDGGFETLRTTVTANGEPMDLQGWTITFMGTTAGNHKIVDANVTLVEAPNGIFNYTPSKAWGMDIGDFKIAYFKFVKGDGSASSANFRVSVIEAVDLTQEEAQNYISVVDTTIAEINQHLNDSLAHVTQSIADANSDANTISSNVTTLGNRIDDYNNKLAAIQVGGRNYVFNSSLLSAINGMLPTVIGNTPSSNVPISLSQTGVKLTTNQGSSEFYYNLIVGWTDIDKTPLEVGQTYTLSFKARGTAGQVVPRVGYIRMIENRTLFNIDATKWTKATLTFTVPATATHLFLRISAGVNGALTGFTGNETLEFKEVMLEQSNVASDWTPAPEDAPSNDTQLVHKTGTETIAGDKTFTSPINGQLSGNAATATKWQTARTLALTGDVTGSVAMDGSGNVSIATTGTNLVHNTGNETIEGDKTFTSTTSMNKLNVSGATTFYTKSINWSTGIMQGNWTLQRIGNWVMAKFDMSATTGTGNTTLTLPIGFRPLSDFVRDLEAGNAGMKFDGSVFISTSYSGSNAMTFIFPTNDAWPA